MKYVLTDAAVRKLRGVLAPRSGNTGAGGAATPVSPDDFPPPFTVRWAQSQNNGSGAWVIWLNSSSTHGLVLVDGALKAITHGITAATGLPTGWFTMDEVASSATMVWLCYGKPKGTASEVLRITNSGLIEDANYVYTSVCVATMSINTATGERRVRQRVRSVVTLTSGSGGGVVPDDISTEFIPDPPSGTQPDGDEGKLQIKGFKAGAPADQNTLSDYLQGVANIPNGGISIVCRGMTSGGRELFYLPLAAIWGDGSGGGLPLPEVTYLDDVIWDPSNHQLVKRWVTKNIVTGIETPVQGAPQGKTATIATTPISSIIGS